MKDNDIIKALECCRDCKCKDCPCYNKETDGCKELDEQDILDLINRQKAEIERLQHIIINFMAEIEDWEYRYNIDTSNIPKIAILGMEKVENIKALKSEAIKEFADEFEKRCIAGGIYPAFVKRQLHDVKKEMVENDFKE